jgi:hypothetical protein
MLKSMPAVEELLRPVTIRAHHRRIGQQDHCIGPQLFGAVRDPGPGTLKFNGG